MNVLRKYLIIVFVLLVVVSCITADEKEEVKLFDVTKYNTIKMMDQIVEEIIFPEITDFNSATVALEAQTNEFLKSITKDNLKDLQNKWLEVAKKWNRVYVFNIGDVSSRGYFRRFISKANKQAIDDYLNSNKTISIDVGADMRSIFVVEYLLFSDTLCNKEDLKIIESFKKSSRKTRFLKLIVSNLVSLAKDFERDWRAYKTVLLSKKVEDLSIDNPLNILLNGAYNVIHYARETKIGKSSGFEKNKYIDLRAIEARYSEKTLILIKENIDMTKRLFFEKEVVSLSDKIRFVTKNEKIVALLQNQFKKIEQALEAFDKSLYYTLYTKDQLEKVEILYNELKQLEKVFLVDIKSALSFIDTGTDGDGD